jgi:hypothetical protein
MKPALVVILSGALTFGVPLIIAMWEVIVLRRNNRGGWGPEGPKAPEPPVPPMGSPPAQRPTTQRPLPACLIPTRNPALPGPRAAPSVRVLEPV